MFYRTLIVLALSILLTACESIGFYRQAVIGQGRLLLAGEPVDQLLTSPETSPLLRQRLELVQSILTFARSTGLEVGDAYSSYVVTGQRFVIWNVFAAPQLELRLRKSCFPVAGCVSYRGFFDEQGAKSYAARLKQEGLDVYIGGVLAYSTLGWFDDPLLDTFIFMDEGKLAALLFHELAHRMVYVKGDTRFNESFATTLEQALLYDWLISRGDSQRFEKYLSSERRSRSVLRLIGLRRKDLKDIYESEKDDTSKLELKTLLISQLVEDYKEHVRQWTEGNEFSYWMRGEINNVKLETIADYNQWVPAMQTFLRSRGLKKFSLEMKRLARLPFSDRQVILASMPISVAIDNK